jgi:LmbE family N-acetylglucosaminyl deacetylase
MTPQTQHLLVAIAHPDDETLGVAGTMARFAEQGWGVTLVCATRGEVGEISDPSLATPETLGAVREQELRAAARVMGVEDVRFLGYRDSGMEGTPENRDPRALCNAERDAVAGEIAAIIRDVRAGIVLTWDASGGYGHPDHIAVHHAATAAFDRTNAERDGPRALYYTTLPVHLWAQLAEELGRQGIQIGSEEQRERAAQLPRLPATTEIEVEPYVERKLESGGKHRTQLPQESPFEKVSPELRRRFVGIEYFYRARPAWREGDPTEHEFWTPTA